MYSMGTWKKHMKKRRKKGGLKEGYKYVRVDHKTIIEVPIDKPDGLAVRDFLARTSAHTPDYLLRRKKHDG
jgi:hypothetical protein